MSLEWREADLEGREGVHTLNTAIVLIYTRPRPDPLCTARQSHRWERKRLETTSQRRLFCNPPLHEVRSTPAPPPSSPSLPRVLSAQTRRPSTPLEVPRRPRKTSTRHSRPAHAVAPRARTSSVAGALVWFAQGQRYVQVPRTSEEREDWEGDEREVFVSS